MRKFIFFAALLAASQAFAATATVSWIAPTTNTNGTAISGALTYNVYQNAVKVQSGVAGLTATVTTGLTAGSTQCFSVSAVEAGVEGAQSLPSCVTLQALTPNAPTVPTVTIT
jgi:hypothetical protein